MPTESLAIRTPNPLFWCSRKHIVRLRGRSCERRVRPRNPWNSGFIVEILCAGPEYGRPLAVDNPGSPSLEKRGSHAPASPGSFVRLLREPDRPARFGLVTARPRLNCASAGSIAPLHPQSLGLRVALRKPWSIYPCALIQPRNAIHGIHQGWTAPWKRACSA